MDALRRLLFFQVDRNSGDLESQKSLAQYEVQTIEESPAGYPRFSALIGSHSSLQVYRKFSALRSRDILLKQDRLSVLEQKLNDVDRLEERPSLLGSCRRDYNPERQAILSEIGKALIEYDETLIRNSDILKLKQARSRRSITLQNWLQGNPYISRNETKFLQHKEDLIALSSAEDESMTGLEEWVQDKLIRFFGNIYKKRCQKLSQDPMVYIPDGYLTFNLARMLLGCFAIILIVAPVIICNSLQDTLPRLIVIIVAISFFIASLSGATQAKTVEIFVAAAAYATVLTVFITQGPSSA